MNRFLLSATSSNVGKTSITMGLIEAFKRRGKSIASFKSGPDYIDPMFHKKALGVDSANLDLFLMGEEYVKEVLMDRSENKDLSIIEGAMGFYDGISTSTEASSYDLARRTKTPVVLVASAKGMGASLGALVKGFLEYCPDNQIKGIILNQTNPMMKSYYEQIIGQISNIKLLGCIPTLEGVEIKSRHLGLITADEVDNISVVISKMADAIEKYVDIDLLWNISTADPISYLPDKRHSLGHVRVAIAKDEAFCFYYEDSLQVLEELGVEWVPFSPLHDKELPENIQGIYLGGGYPELYMDELEMNRDMLLQVKKSYEAGKVLLCECGGFMTLFDFFKGEKDYTLMGLLEGQVQMTNKLNHFGYVELDAQSESLLASKGQKLKGHEFHYSISSNDGQSFVAKKPSSHRSWACVHGNKRLYAGYPHIHLGSQKKARIKFIQTLLEVQGEEK